MLWPTTGARLSAALVAAAQTLVYEWTHYLIHTDYKPKRAFHRRLYTHHRLHHFRNERYWFGVSRTLADTVLRTSPGKDQVPPSPTAKREVRATRFEPGHGVNGFSRPSARRSERKVLPERGAGVLTRNRTTRARPLGKAPLDIWRFTVAIRVDSGRVPGTLAILSCPPALCPHAEFGVAAILGVPVSLAWSGQPAAPGALLATMDYAGPPGTAARLAARLRQLGPVAFEVVEGPAPGNEPERLSYVPALGMFRAAISPAGEIVVGEGPLRDLIGRAGSSPELALGLDRLLGTAWDEELEPLRQGGDGAPITWLRRTG